MPHIYDNITEKFMPALEAMLGTAYGADFCVGYFNLRGWNRLGEALEARFTGEDDSRCRLLVGMHRVPEDEIRDAYGLVKETGLDQARAVALRRRMAEEFRNQLTIGAPSDADEKGLQRLARQLRSGKLIVKLFLKNTLHAKLYLLHRNDVAAPVVGYVGSSNLTFAGLMKQFELNVDVVEGDAAAKLAKWFNDRWNDRWCLDITEDLAKIIEESWAREELIPPYHIYVKMAYHLAQEAVRGIADFRIPNDFGNELFDFQVKAVQIASRALNNERRHGVILGDVVGLGKTLMASAVARIAEDDLHLETLIICPRNLVKMWESYVHKYRMRAKVMSITRYPDLENLPRYRVLILDESHNLRNPQSNRHRAIREYIERNGCRCILLSATPYNKDYKDLGAQLRLFLDADMDLGIRPEALLRKIGEINFQSQHQCSPSSLAAFEKSDEPDDWRDLMRSVMVRRTRGFIKENYTKSDDTGRPYLLTSAGARAYFPDRVPKTIRFKMDPNDLNDPYARLYDEKSVEKPINRLQLPRYGLGNYEATDANSPPTNAEALILKDLSRAGKRLKGFCRTNLFKRLESSGLAFVQSLERHILRNYIFVHAIRHDLPLPIGTTDPNMLSTSVTDVDPEDKRPIANPDDDTGEPEGNMDGDSLALAMPERRYQPMTLPAQYRKVAAQTYSDYSSKHKKKFRWLRSSLFQKDLCKDLLRDANRMRKILKERGTWNAALDCKLERLYELIAKEHPSEKILVFSQFADTVNYLAAELERRGVTSLKGVTGSNEDPTAIAHRFSPVSNDARHNVKPDDEIRVLIATDVLSEGQNLQDAFIVVNFDLPWAIVRLIQRVGRVDRIGQKHPQIYCYCFWPMDGVERVINLRKRVSQRLKENAEVVGTDEQFFDDQVVDQTYRDLYHESAGSLDGEDDMEVDLNSYAFEIWKKACDADTSLKRTIEGLPDVVFSAKEHRAQEGKPNGALVYMKTREGNDALAWVDEAGKLVSHSPLAVLRAAECKAETPAQPRAANHHEIVRRGVEHMVEEEMSAGGQLGRKTGVRYRTYERLKRHAERLHGTVLAYEGLDRVLEDIYKFPLRQSAADTLNRQLRASVSDETLSEICVGLRDDGRLCVVSEDEQRSEPKIICSLGLVHGAKTE